MAGYTAARRLIRSALKFAAAKKRGRSPPPSPSLDYAAFGILASNVFA